jgi:hypothetical protein
MTTIVLVLFLLIIDIVVLSCGDIKIGYWCHSKRGSYLPRTRPFFCLDLKLRLRGGDHIRIKELNLGSKTLFSCCMSRDFPQKVLVFAGLDAALFDPEENFSDEEDLDPDTIRGTEDADGAASQSWKFLSGGVTNADLVRMLAPRADAAFTLPLSHTYPSAAYVCADGPTSCDRCCTISNAVDGGRSIPLSGGQGSASALLLRRRLRGRMPLAAQKHAAGLVSFTSSPTLLPSPLFHPSPYSASNAIASPCPSCTNHNSFTTFPRVIAGPHDG